MIFWLFLFLVAQGVLLIVAYKIFRKKPTISQQDIETAEYIKKLEKQIDIEYYI